MQLVLAHKRISYFVGLIALVALVITLASLGYNALAGVLFFAAGAAALVYVFLRRPTGNRRETRTDLEEGE